MPPAADAYRFGLWLRHQIENGLAVTPDVSAYLDATFGCTDLVAILETAESSDIDTLTDLLFFPDEALRLDFEAQWGHADFDEADIDAIRSRMTADPPQALIATDRGGAGIRLEMPAFAVESLLRRLNLSFRPDPGLEAVLDGMAAERRTEVRMHLRCARLAWHTGQIDFLRRYLSRVPSDAPDFIETLVFATEVLPDMPAGVPSDLFLSGLKRSYFQAWSRAAAYERRRRAANMEILMLQGERAAHGDPQHWSRQMDRVDRLSRVLFQHIEWIPVPIESHRDQSPEDDLEGLLGFFT